MDEKEAIPETDVVRLLLELKAHPENPVPIFRKLEEETGAVPYREESRGKYRLLVADWIAWGIETGILTEEDRAPTEEDRVPTEEDRVPAEESPPPDANPLIAALNGLSSRLDDQNRKIGEIGEGFRKMTGVLNLLVDQWVERNRPWSDRGPLPEKELTPGNGVPGVPSAGESKPSARAAPVKKDPPVIREGRVYQ